MIKNRVIWVMAWTEIEPGWGERPDGITIYDSVESCLQHIKKVQEVRTKERYAEYSMPDWSKPKRVYIEPGSQVEVEYLNSIPFTFPLYAGKALEKAIKEHLSHT
jgi:hypothetical protein